MLSGLLLLSTIPALLIEMEEKPLNGRHIQLALNYWNTEIARSSPCPASVIMSECFEFNGKQNKCVTNV